ncbi:MAG TPA: alpha/beta fold hydrolase, partial [Hellea balneolensis]|nr:alpha/beta fold hydrolase [Hellea balneolensis]
ERVRGVISICTPHTKYPPVDPLAIFEKRHGKDHYCVAYQQQGVAEALFDQDPFAVFKMLFQTVPKGTKPSHEMYHLLKNFKAYMAAGAPDLPGAVMSREDMQVFAGAYTHSGFHGGINLYRNTTENWQYGASLDTDIEQPSLMISTENDLFLPPSATDHMPDLIADLERTIIEDCGHWAMWEKPDAINQTMIEWLHRKMGLRFF